MNIKIDLIIEEREKEKRNNNEYCQVNFGQFKDKTTYIEEIILIVTLPFFTPTLLSTAYVISGSGHSTREWDIYICVCI